MLIYPTEQTKILCISYDYDKRKEFNFEFAIKYSCLFIEYDWYCYVIHTVTTTCKRINTFVGSTKSAGSASH